MDPLEVPGELDSLEPVAEYVKQAAAEAGLEPKDAYKLRLAVDEIATNIVLYGYERSGRTGTLRLTADVAEDALRLTVEDTSPPYDYRAQAVPDGLDSPLEDRQVGGLGVFLAVNGVDDFAWTSADGRNRSTFTVLRRVHVPGV